MKKKNLFLLDLDHTLIYGSYAKIETAEFLFQHNHYLKVYKRNLAEELVKRCQSKGDVIVYTTALRKYAKTICNKLNINPIELLSRKNCKMINGHHKKIIRKEWLDSYDRLIVIDDSPNVWLNDDKKVLFLVPMEFRGNKEDIGLQEIIDKLNKI